MKRKILVTGAAGRIGSCVADGLRSTGKYEVVATDIRPDPEHGVSKLDITDGEAVAAALRVSIRCFILAGLKTKTISSGRCSPLT